MELEELKTVWASVDERLKENEMLNKRMVQEMLYKKSNKSLNWLINTEIINNIVLLLTIPLCIFLYHLPVYKHLISPKILFITVIVGCIFGSTWSLYTLKKYLLKIDFSKSIKDNMYYLNNFNIYFKRGKIISYYVIIPVLYILGIWGYFELKAPFYLWIFLVIMFILGIFGTYWLNKKIYDTNIQSIKKSIEELEELKELDVSKD